MRYRHHRDVLVHPTWQRTCQTRTLSTWYCNGPWYGEMKVVLWIWVLRRKVFLVLVFWSGIGSLCDVSVMTENLGWYAPIDFEVPFLKYHSLVVKCVAERSSMMIDFPMHCSNQRPARHTSYTQEFFFFFSFYPTPRIRLGLGYRLASSYSRYPKCAFQAFRFFCCFKIHLFWSFWRSYRLPCCGVQA